MLNSLMLRRLLEIITMRGRVPAFLLTVCLAAFLAIPVSGLGTEGAQLPAWQDKVNRFFTDPALGETRAMIVMKDGKIVAERYGAGYTPDTRFIAWSMAKSVTSVLIGILVDDGTLTLDDRAPVPAWSKPGDRRAAITLRQLLHMSSGLDHIEVGKPIYDSDTTRMLFGSGAADMAAYAEHKGIEAKPDAKYEYSSATSVILADIITNHLTQSPDPTARRNAMRSFIRERLTTPARLPSFTPEFDKHGTFIGGSFLHADARDYARFGEMLRLGGQIDGQRVVSENWVGFMRTPASTDGGYGGHIWLNRLRPRGSEPALFPGTGPDTLFSCIGHLGQYVMISPDQGLVIVRLGKTNDPDLEPVRKALGDLVASFPAEDEPHA
jgi:CubicO group peptidase (beta-lactamase class C family)